MSQYSPVEKVHNTKSVASKMGEALVCAWNKGERKLVKQTIINALGNDTKKQWYLQTAMMIEDTNGNEEYKKFATFMAPDIGQYL